MLDVRKFRPCPQFHFLLFLFLFALSILAVAQDKDRDKDKDKDRKDSDKAATNRIKVDGTVRCAKPETDHSIDVPDRPGHALIIDKRKCTWTEPIELQGAKMKDGVLVNFTERMEKTLHIHSFEVDKLESGEEITIHSSGQIAGEKGPASGKGRWDFMRGTGKYKGIRGNGTYEAKLDAEDVLTFEFEGSYDPTAMVGEKK
jgi:hypothetical protein